jgi:membrane protease YdiL (CAAX protease family)
VDTSPPSLSPFELIITVILNFAIVGLAEEFCFRGVLLKEFSKKSKFRGLLISSGFFMIYHVFPGIVPLSTFLTFWLYYFIFGVILAGITLLNKGDLIMAIIAHGSFNSILFILSYTDWLG